MGLNPADLFPEPSAGAPSEISEETLHWFDLMDIGVIVQDAPGRILLSNQTARKFFLAEKPLDSPDWVITRDDGSPLPASDHPLTAALQKGSSLSGEILRFSRPDLSKFYWLKIAARPVTPQGRVCITFQDITLQKQTENKLNERLKELTAFYSLAALANEERPSINDFCVRVTEILPKSWQYPEITACRIDLDGVEYSSPNFRDTPWKLASPIRVQNKISGVLEIVYLAARPAEDEGPFLKEERFLLNAFVEWLGQTIESQRITQALSQKSHALQMLSSCNHALVKSHSETELLNHICRIAVEEGDYLLSWVGYAEDNPQKSVLPIAQFGFEAGYLENAGITWDESARGMGPTGTAIRTGQPSIAQNILNDPRFSPWRAAALKRGYASSIALPINWHGRTIGALMFYSREPYAFQFEEVNLLMELVSNVAIGIESIRANQHYRLISENSLDVIWMIDAETRRFTYFSPSVLKMYGYTPAEALQKSFSDFLTPDSLATIQDLITRNILDTHFNRSSPPPPIELDHLRKDGSIVKAEVSASLALDTRGKLQIIGISRDITRRKQVESVLRFTEETRQSLLEAISESVLLIRPDGMGIMANSTTLKRLNISLEQFKTRNVYELLPPDVADERKQRVQTVLETRQPLQFEDHRNGKTILNRINPVFDSESQITSLAIIGFDITDLREAEATVTRLSRVVEQMADTMVITDINGTIEYVNPAFEKETGYTLDEVRGQNPRILKSGVHSQLFYQDMWDQIIQGHVFEAEIVNRKKNGELFLEMKTITPVMNNHGQVIYFIATGKDITDRRHAEEKLLASEHRNAAIVNAIPDLIFRVNREGLFLDYIAKLTDRLYAPPEVFIGKKITDVMPPDVAEKSLNAIAVAFETNQLQSFEYTLPFEDREEIYEARISPNKTDNEAVIIVRDVSAQRLMEKGIRQNEEKYRLLSEQLEARVQERTAAIQDLYDNAPTGYHSLDASGTFQMMNLTELRWLGYSADEIIGKKKFSDLVVPDQLDKYWQDFNHFKEQGHVENLEFDLLRKDGSIFPVIINSVAILNPDGSFSHSRSNMFDNTERKAVDAEIRRINNLSDTALELARAGYWYSPLDGSGNCIYSDRVISILGDPPRADHQYNIQRDWAKNVRLANPQAAPHSIQEFQDVLNGSLEEYNSVYEYMRPIDGRIIWIHAIGHVIHDISGKPVGISGVSQDITETKKMELDLQKAKVAAETANVAKSVFLANMSHEIRTPMNAILGFTQIILKDQNLTPQNRNYLDIISRSGEHLLTLINEILEMSKIEAGHVTYNPATFNLPRMIKDIASMFNPRMEAKNLGMNLEMDPSLNEFIISDENKVKEILINLVGNAVKFTHAGSITLRCRTDQDPASQDPNDLILQIEVEDTGSGIAPEDMHRLFKAFEQTRSGSGQIGGTGLGLAISQSHAGLMGGEISVTSQVGKGSCFRVRLKVKEGEAAITDGQSISTRKITGLKPDAPETRILIVDDSEENRMVLNAFLEPIGVSIRFAENGQTAVQTAVEWQPGLVLMDLRMPVMDGFEASRQIRQHPRCQQTSIIAITASVIELDKQKVLDSGMNGFIHKPFKENELLSVLQNQLGDIFIYNDETNHVHAGPQEGTLALTPELIATLPVDLVEKLKFATINARFDELMDLLDLVDEHSPQIAFKLRTLASEFQYDTLISLF